MTGEKKQWTKRVALEMGIGEDNTWHRWYDLVPHLYVPGICMKVLRKDKE